MNTWRQVFLKYVFYEIYWGNNSYNLYLNFIVTGSHAVKESECLNQTRVEENDTIIDGGGLMKSPK